MFSLASRGLAIHCCAIEHVNVPLCMSLLATSPCIRTEKRPVSSDRLTAKEAYRSAKVPEASLQ